MKDSSLKLLQIVYDKIKDSWDKDAEDSAEIIKQIIAAESISAKKGKFNIWNYTMSKRDGGDLRPQMMCVYHDRGYQVATNSKIICAVKVPYSPELEGKCLASDGRIEKDYKYPRWECVLPSNLNEHHPVQIDKDKFYNGLNEVRTEYTLETGKKSQWDSSFIVHIDEAYFTAQLFNMLINAMEFIGTDTIYVKDHFHGVFAQSENGKVLLMPRVSDTIEETDKVIEL